MSLDPDGAPLERLVTEARELFGQQFARPPAWIVAAPGRVNLIGDHVDYNQGVVLPMAIDRQTVIAADLDTRAHTRAPPQATVYTSQLRDLRTMVPRQSPAAGQPRWTRYIQGVLDEFAAQIAPIPSFAAVVHSNVPLGGGLSSSAALEVAVATLLEELTGVTLAADKKALLCQRAEHVGVGVPCGIMDQFSAVFSQSGHFMLLDCESHARRMVPLADPNVVILIIDSEVQHELAAGEYAERRRQCEDAARALGVASLREVTADMLADEQGRLEATLYRRARHVVSEIARTLQTADQMEAGVYSEVGQQMFASHASLRDDFEVSCAQLDLLVEAARQFQSQGDLYGARMTGGGFGGSTVNLLPAARAVEVAASICETYRQEFGQAATAFTTRPASGAHVVDRV